MPEEVVDNPSAVASPEATSSAPSALEAMNKAEASLSSSDTPKPAEGTIEGVKPVASTSETPVAKVEKVDALPEPRAVAIARNAREEVERKYAHVQGITPENVQQFKDHSSVIQELRTDAKGFVTRLAAELGMTITPTKQEAPIPTEGDLITEQGTRAFSDKLVMRIVNDAVQKAVGTLRGELKPIQDRFQSQDQQAQQQRAQQETRDEAVSIMEEAKSLPHFTEENMPKIREIFLAIPAAERNKNVRASVLKAYTTFLSSNVFPGIQTAAEQKAVDSFKRKAASSVGAHPVGSGGDPKPPKLDSVSALSQHMEQLERQLSTQ